MSTNFRRGIVRFAIHRVNNNKRNICSSTPAHHNNKPTTRIRGRIQSLPSSCYIHQQHLQLRYFSDSSTRDNVKEEGQSLHASIHFILKRIPIGQITHYDLERARAFLSIASKWNNEQGATLSEKLLERIYAEQNRNANITVNAEMYNICMNAWIKSGVDGDRIIYNVESIMNRMEERYRLNETTTARPDKFGYNCLINAYSKSSKDSSEKVEAILEKMNALANEAASSDNELDREYALLIRPDTYTYNSIMNYYATRQNDYKAAQRCEDLLLYQSELLSKDGNNNVQMESTSFNIVLKAWGNSNTGIEGAKRAENVLRMMIKLYSHGHDEVKPDAISFSTVIGAYSKLNSEDASIALDNVLSILDELEGSYIDSSDDININSCYNAAANMIVKSGFDNAVERVQELMARMKNMDAVPDKYMISSLVEAYGNEGSDESFRQGKELLLEMMDKPEIEPNTVPFNILLNAILKGSSIDKIQQAEDLITSMNNIGGDARPDLATYNMIISALSRSSAPDSQQKATEYLRHMLKSYREGYEKAKPDSFVFNCIISLLSRSEEEWADNAMYRTLMAMESQQKNGNTSVISDTITYNLVIGKLSKKPSTDNAKKIMTLLQKMEDNKSKTISPDIITYTSVLQLQDRVNPGKAAVIAATYLERVLSNNEKIQIDQIGLKTLLKAISRSNKIEHARLASKAWTRMEKEDESILDSDLCNLVLISYRKVNDTNGAEEALSFLSDRIRQYKEGKKSAVLPSVIGFGVTIASLANANKLGDAYLLIDIMKSLSKEVPTVKPDEGCYISILNAMESVENAASQVLSLLKRMKNDDIEMSTKSLNSAMNLIRSTTLIGDDEAKRKAIEVAFEVFHLGKEHRDSVTFALMIKVCMRLTNDEDTRIKLVEPLFKLCAKSGLVSNMVTQEVKHLKKGLIQDELPTQATSREAGH